MYYHIMFLSLLVIPSIFVGIIPIHFYEFLCIPILWLVTSSITGWWFQPTPLKNDGSLSVMMKFPRYGVRHLKFHGSKPPTSCYYVYFSKWPLK